MGVETATYINDFDTSLPTATDLRSQGDDHIRLMKAVLKTAFTGATRTFQIPGILSKTADYTVVKADGESTVYCTTAAGSCSFTLPSLAALDAGWKIHFIKTNSGANPMFIVPPSGTINSGGISALAKARRSIPGVRVTAIWDGTGWFVTRALAIPIGTMLPYDSATLPAGYEWPNGQTLASASTNYPEYNNAKGSGVTLDKRGRVGVTLDNLGGSAAGRLAGGIITGTAVANTGGTDTVTLSAAQIPSITSTVTTTSDSSTILGGVILSNNISFGNSGSLQPTAAVQAFTLTSIARTSTGTATSNNTSGALHSNLQPSMMVAEILVVE